MGTLMTMRMMLPDAETRRQMLATGMERGMEASYVRLETLLGAGNGLTFSGGFQVAFADDRPLSCTMVLVKLQPGSGS